MFIEIVLSLALFSVVLGIVFMALRATPSAIDSLQGLKEEVKKVAEQKKQYTQFSEDRAIDMVAVRFKSAFVAEEPFLQMLSTNFVIEDIPAATRILDQNGEAVNAKIVYRLRSLTNPAQRLELEVNSSYFKPSEISSTVLSVDDWVRDGKIKMLQSICLRFDPKECNEVCDHKITSIIASCISSCSMTFSYKPDRTENFFYPYTLSPSKNGWYWKQQKLGINLWDQAYLADIFTNLTLKSGGKTYKPNGEQLLSIVEESAKYHKNVVVRGRAGTGKSSFIYSAMKHLRENAGMEVLTIDGTTLTKLIAAGEVNTLRHCPEGESCVVFVDEANEFIQNAENIVVLKSIMGNNSLVSFVFAIDDAKLTPQLEREGRIDLQVEFAAMPKASVHKKLNILKTIFHERVFNQEQYNALGNEVTLAEVINCFKEKSFHDILEGLVAKKEVVVSPSKNLSVPAPARPAASR